jgi:WD40 repeat protein
MEKKYLGFTSVAVSGQSINIGSKLGTVYIYDVNDLKETVENNNLVTHITQLKANKTGEYTLALSKWKNNAIRVIDSMTGKAIGEWPGVKTKVGLPMQAAFNEANYFGVGSSHGHISIYGFSNEMI